MARGLTLAVARCRLPLLAVLCGGCALNDHGLLRVSRYESETAYVLSLESWGAHLLTSAGDGGITFGYTDRTYVFPKNEGDAKVPLAALTGGGGMQPWACDACPSLSEMGTPIFRAGRRVGLILDANADRVGIAFGLRFRAGLALPTDGSAVVLLRYDAGDGVPPDVIIGKEIER